jgi:hypothetical protein
VVHDLNHLGQIVKTMAKQYTQAVARGVRSFPSSTQRTTGLRGHERIGEGVDASELAREIGTELVTLREGPG